MRSPISLATALFIDIVDSPERATELGPESWHVLLQKRDALIRRELRRWGATCSAAAGDGFLASFGQPARAIRCACAIAEAMHSLGLEIRSGLHLGETAEGDGVGGIAASAATRIAAAAQPGELLVSGLIRDVLARSPFGFKSRGARYLEGLAGAWQLFAVTNIPSLPEVSLSPWWLPRLSLWQGIVAAGFVAALVMAGILYVVNYVWPHQPLP
jgi:class 3 adenylate cyclase